MTSLFLVLATTLASTESGILGGLSFPERSALVSSSITFENTDSTGTCLSSLNNGGTIKAWSSKGRYNGGMEVSSTAYCLVSYVDNGESNQSFTIGGNSYELAPFQSINAIKVTHDGNVKGYYSTDGISFTDMSPVSDFRYTSVAGAKFIYFSATSRSSISKLIIEYSCNSSVEPVLSGISLSGSYKTEFSVGDSFDTTGLVVTATYDYGGSPRDVTSSCEISSPDMFTTGEKQIEVSYTEGSVTKYAYYSINVSEASSGLSGTYSGTYTSIEFTSGTQGTYIYGSERLYFTYVVSESSITFTYVSGDNTSFGSYRLFAGGSSPKANATGVINSASSISVKTYNMFDSATNRTFTK